MPVNIDTVTSDVQVDTRGGGTAPEHGAAPLPKASENQRWRLSAHAVARDLTRLRATDQDD